MASRVYGVSFLFLNVVEKGEIPNNQNQPGSNFIVRILQFGPISIPREQQHFVRRTDLFSRRAPATDI
jgi:hypothetical protein